jgi:hypothetical protein
MGTSVNLGAAKRRKIFPCWESNPGHPANRLSLYRLCSLVKTVYSWLAHIKMSKMLGVYDELHRVTAHTYALQPDVS